MPKSLLIVFAIVIILIAAGILVVGKLTRPATYCTEEYIAGLSIELEDEKNAPISRATITSNSNPTPFDSFEEGLYAGLWEEEGTHTYTITHPEYKEQSGEITLQRNDCHVIPQQRRIQLSR